MNIYNSCLLLSIIVTLAAQAIQPGTNIWNALHDLQQKCNQQDTNRETDVLKDVCSISHTMQQDMHALNQSNKELAGNMYTIMQDKHANQQFQNNMLKTLHTLAWYNEENSAFLNKTKEEFDCNIIALAADLKMLHDRLRTIESRNESFLICQNSIGQGDSYSITQPGYYTLTEPLSFSSGTAILIKASQVVLDLNGMFIDGGTSDIDSCAITITDVSNVTIKNGIIRGSQGIVLSHARDITIKNIDAIENQKHAIVLHNVQQAHIKDCMISQVIDGSGLMTDVYCKNIIIKQCIATLCAHHGYALSGTDIVLLNSIAQTNGKHGVFCSELVRGHIQENTIEGNGCDGILLGINTLDIETLSNRILGNKNIGLNNESTNAMCLNNFSARNGTDYEGIKALPISKATSFWHNVYG
ncbi:MAG TPA: right-handed parallel beta-helix repeat-containing protein [Candidatus Babeliales bacterium]|jgi:hypothetical protein|nr:right-handed parallel beta-helix repeat-containing protein [Candidatus Babeliales bacterium]